MTLLIITITVTTNILCYYIGKYKERIDWNKLIEKGIIQKPKNKIV